MDNCTFRAPPQSDSRSRTLTVLVVASLLVMLTSAVVTLHSDGEPVQAANATVSGTVFQDFNANGQRDTTLRLGRAVDSGVAGINVRAVDSSGLVVGTATSSADGTFVVDVSVPVGTPLRVEFEIPSGPEHLKGLQPSTAVLSTGASDSTRGTQIQFALAGDSNVNFAVNSPGDYCQDDPHLVTCTNDRGAGSTSNVGAFTLPGSMVNFPNYSPNSTRIGSSADLGAIFGIGVDRNRNVFLGTYVKRHVEYGKAGPTNSIYRINLDHPDEVSVFVTLPGDLPLHDPLPAGSLPAYSGDTAIFSQVGRIGLGDVDVTPDGKTLLAVDMDETAPKLYFIDLQGSGDDVTTGAISVIAIPQPATFNGVACPDKWHPMGLGVRGDRILVGGVCGAEGTVSPTLFNGPHLTQSTTFILEYADGGQRNGSGTFTTIWAQALGYERGCVYREGTRINCAEATSRVGTIGTADWGAWNEYPILIAYDGPSGISFASNPQAMLANIEILDTGGLILGFRDRYQDQIMRGSAAYSLAYEDPAYTNPPIAYPRRTAGVAGGDIMRVCWTPTGLVTEAGGTCPASDLPGGAHLDASGQREYFQDAYTLWGSPPNHSETFTGGMASRPGFPGGWTTAYDINKLGSQGIYAIGPVAARLGTTSRGSSTGYGAQIGGYDFGNLNYFNKGIGLADIEVLCDQAPIQIGDRIWFDLDNDGVQDAGEPGLSGVTVTLRDANGVVIASTVTDSNGQYWFSTSDGLQPDTAYTISFDHPPDYAPGGPLYNFLPTESQVGSNSMIDSDATVSAGTFGVDVFPEIAVAPLSPGDNNHSFDAGFTRPVAMGDRVWVDLDGDGVQDANEPGLAGVVVTLLQADGVTPVLNSLGQPAVAVTDAFGFYVIDDLAPGEYVAKFEIPEGYRFTVTGSATPSTDSDAYPATSGALTAFSQPFTIAAGPSGDTISTATDYPSLRAGHINPTIDAGVIPLGTIGDFVWLDTNGDGLQNGGEPGIAGLTVTLIYPDGSTVSTVTDQQGRYLFEDLPPGEYTVEVEIPTGYVPTLEGAGSAFNDSSGVLVAGSTTVSATTTLSWGAMHDLTLDFGFVAPVVEVGGQISLDGTDRGVAGVTVTIFDSDGLVVATAITDAEGRYLFDGLVPGEYSVTMTTPDGTTTSAVSVSAQSLDTHGESDLDVDFTLFAPRVTVGDLVWLDTDGDGQINGSEIGIPGVIVTITTADGDLVTDVFGQPVFSTITDATGNYSFSDLPPGDYVVTVSALPGLTLTTSTSATTSGLVNDGDADVSLDFGFTSSDPAILGYVWADTNGDGLVSGSELPLAGITVTLYDVTGSALATATTDAQGRYVFGSEIAGLLAGEDYELVFSDFPEGYAASTPDSVMVSSLTGVDVTTSFGLQPLVSVGDLIWFDSNRDGIQSAGEPGIAGVKVILFDAAGNKVGETFTDADGRYLFDGLPVGVYSVSVAAETLPVGLVPTLTNVGPGDMDSSFWSATSAPLLTAGASDMTLDFGFWGPSVSVGDFVWHDINNDGIQGIGEPGIAGVTVSITTAGGAPVTDIFGQPVTDIVTDANGNYMFEHLPPGQYIVSVTAPDGFDPAPANVGPSSTDSSSGSAMSLILLVDGAHDPTLDFGFWAPSVSVGDLVWFDANGDGVHDPSEPGIAGVTLMITTVDGDPVTDIYGQLVAPTVTDGDGNYLFENLPLGQYIVVVDLSSVLPGLTATTLTSATSAALSTHDAKDLSLDFGFTAPFVTVGDLVWLDENADGLQGLSDPDDPMSPMEPGIPGVTLTITDAAGDPVTDVFGRLVGPVVTDADGKYEFTYLPPGEYTVWAATPAGFIPTFAEMGDDREVDSSRNFATSADLVGGESDLSLDFGFVPAIAVQALSVSVAGVLWEDRIPDLEVAETEPRLGEVYVRITDLNGDPVVDIFGNEVADEITNALGAYEFLGLLPGAYRVIVVDPPASLVVVLGESGIETGDLVAGEVIENLNFGFRSPPAPAAAVVDGGNNSDTGSENTEADSFVSVVGVVAVVGELGECVAGRGVRVWLTDPDGVAVRNSFGELVEAVTTNEAGHFAFIGLAPGRYLVWRSTADLTGFRLAPVERIMTSDLVAPGGRFVANFGCDLAQADPVSGRLPATGSEHGGLVDLAWLLLLIGLGIAHAAASFRKGAKLSPTART